MTSLLSQAVPLVDLLAGSTLLLGLGAMASGVATAPVHRQRSAELAVLATLVWLALAAVPIPRWPAGPTGGERFGEAEAGAVAVTVPRMEPGETGIGSGPSSVADERVQSVGDGAATGADERAVRATREPPGGAQDARVLPSERRFRDALADPTRWLRRLHLTGSILVAGYVLLGFVLVRRLLGATAEPSAWQAMEFAERMRALGVRRARLRIGRSRRRPVTTGLLRPTVVVPSELARRGREAELRRVIDHELVHVYRRDVLGRVLFAAAAPLLWLHPLFWWLRSRASLAAELIADDGAAGGDRAGYARDLLSLAGELQTLRPAPGHAPGTFRNRSELTRRIAMLMHRHDRFAGTCSPRRRALNAIVLTSALAAAVAAFGARPLPAQEGVRPSRPAADRAVAADPGIAAAEAEARSGQRATQPAAPVGRAVSGRAAGPEPAGPSREDPSESAADAPADDVARLAGAPSVGLATQTRQEPDPGYAATLELADRALTLLSDLALATAELESVQREHAVDRRVGGPVDDLDVRRAQITLEGVHRRLAAVRILVETEIEATGLEITQLDQAMRLGTEGPGARPRLIRLNARLKVLESLF